MTRPKSTKSREMLRPSECLFSNRDWENGEIIVIVCFVTFMFREVYTNFIDFCFQKMLKILKGQPNTSKGHLSLCLFSSSLCLSHLMPQSCLWPVFLNDNVTAAPPRLVRAAAGLPMSTSFERFLCSYSSWHLL